MAKQVGNKFVWALNVSSFQHGSCYSSPVLIGGYKWCVTACPGNQYDGDHCLSLFLSVVDTESLPSGWRVYVKFSLTINNQHYVHGFIRTEGGHWFDKQFSCWGFGDIIPIFHLLALSSGFVMNGELLVIAEIEVLEIIDTLSASQVTEISDNSEHRGHDYPSSPEDMHNKNDVTVEVNGFQVLDSQVNQVKAMLEKHPDLASNLNLENQQLKNAYMYALLDVMKTMSKLPKEITEEDLNKADSTLSHLIKAGLNLNWLRQKMDQAFEKQIAYDTRIKELEKQVKKRKLALAELEGALEKEKAAASAQMMFFD